MHCDQTDVKYIFNARLVAVIKLQMCPQLQIAARFSRNVDNGMNSKRSSEGGNCSTMSSVSKVLTFALTLFNVSNGILFKNRGLSPRANYTNLLNVLVQIVNKLG
jgi:hypothetical protein